MKRRRTHPPPSRNKTQPKLITTTLLWLFGLSTLAYYLILAAIYALAGERLASWFANPLFGIAVFLITRWEVHQKFKEIGWRKYFRILKVSKLILISITIFAGQLIVGLLAGAYLILRDPTLETNGALDALNAMESKWGSLIIALVGAALAYFIGGYIAGKICRRPDRAPFGHAMLGAFITFSVNFVWIEYLYICDCGTKPTQEDVGIYVLLLPLVLACSFFGAWVALKRIKRRLSVR